MVKHCWKHWGVRIIKRIIQLSKSIHVNNANIPSFSSESLDCSPLPISKLVKFARQHYSTKALTKH